MLYPMDICVQNKAEKSEISRNTLLLLLCVYAKSFEYSKNIQKISRVALPYVPHRNFSITDIFAAFSTALRKTVILSLSFIEMSLFSHYPNTIPVVYNFGSRNENIPSFSLLHICLFCTMDSISKGVFIAAVTFNALGSLYTTAACDAKEISWFRAIKWHLKWLQSQETIYNYARKERVMAMINN